jgi:hypothetical protein
MMLAVPVGRFAVAEGRSATCWLITGAERRGQISRDATKVAGTPVASRRSPARWLAIRHRTADGVLRSRSGAYRVTHIRA